MTRQVVVAIADQKKKKNRQKPPRMLTPPERICIKQIPLGDLMRNKKFNSFDSMRQQANRVVGKMRQCWMDFVLMKAGIYINYAEITKREIIEIYERNQLSIVNVENVDRIYQGDILLGEWDRDRTIFFDDEGRLMMEIRYFAL